MLMMMVPTCCHQQQQQQRLQQCCTKPYHVIVNAVEPKRPKLKCTITSKSLNTSRNALCAFAKRAARQQHGPRSTRALRYLLGSNNSLQGCSKAIHPSLVSAPWPELHCWISRMPYQSCRMRSSRWHQRSYLNRMGRTSRILG